MQAYHFISDKEEAALMQAMSCEIASEIDKAIIL